MPLFRTRYNRDYFHSPFTRQRHASQRNCQRLSLIRSLCPAGVLLEVGCGTGEFLRLAQPHYTVECMEISDYAAQRVEDELGIRPRVVNIEEATVPFQRYHVIAAFNVLEHLYDPGSVLRKMYYSLRPGGLLVGSMPLNYALLGSLHTLLTNLFDRTHVSTLPPGRWQKLFAQAGFRPVSFFGEFMFGPNRNRYVRSPLWPYLSFNLMFAAYKPG
jgi:2-polyprenyl-3-methyl-5-hydroxy-6-metoxy-1,4-benzoquinol methylase